MKRALLSVSDKTGIVEFAKELSLLGYEIISTGGTLSTLISGGIKAKNISEITNFPECLDGRVKTLHPAVHAGLLAIRDNPLHMRCLAELGLSTIDVVAVNLYPFKNTILNKHSTFADAVENIDIGGPSMLRAAAKNYRFVYVACDWADYPLIIDELKSGNPSEDKRLYLMYKAYQHTAVYDTLIAGYLREKLEIKFPSELTFAYEKQQDLRYGENPHQSAAFYRESLPQAVSLAGAEQLAGKELSFNNINDTNGALDLLREFSEPAAVAVKHANPCGAGVGKDIYDAYNKAYQSDPVSIFGGIVAVNRTVDLELSTTMAETFLEVVLAPDFTKDAVALFKERRKNTRLLKINNLFAGENPTNFDIKKVAGGLLLQEPNSTLYNKAELKVVTQKAPTKEECAALEFAFKVVKHTKSNAIVVANGESTLGIGMGQTSRIWAAEEALSRAAFRAKGAVLASDAFFPFPDCVEAAEKYGITAIIQPGGSVNDQKSIDACNKAGIAMVFCQTRHFKH